MGVTVTGDSAGVPDAEEVEPTVKGPTISLRSLLVSKSGKSRLGDGGTFTSRGISTSDLVFGRSEKLTRHDCVAGREILSGGESSLDKS